MWAVVAWEEDTVPTVELFANQEEAASRALIFAQFVPTALVKTKENAS